MPLTGFLDSTSPDLYTIRPSAFRVGLKEAGYVEGYNVAIEYRSSNYAPGSAVIKAISSFEVGSA
jgi:hypothetical protein